MKWEQLNETAKKEIETSSKDYEIDVIGMLMQIMACIQKFLNIQTIYYLLIGKIKKLKSLKNKIC